MTIADDPGSFTVRHAIPEADRGGEEGRDGDVAEGDDSAAEQEPGDSAAAPGPGDSAAEPGPGESAAEPAPRESASAPGPDESQDGRQMIWLVGAGLALIVATVVTMVTLWPDSDENPSAAVPPVATWPAPAEPAPSRATGPASPSASVRSSPSPSISSSPTPSPSVTRPTTRPAPPPPSPTLAPPPAANRVGPITGPGGDCLDVAAGIVVIGDVVVLRDCNRTTSQRWTVATDGTLRVAGSCALAGGSGQVTVNTCGDAAAGQWRAGPGGSLVNLGSGNCLTGSVPDNRVRVTPCGAGGQVWALP